MCWGGPSIANGAGHILGAAETVGRRLFPPVVPLEPPWCIVGWVYGGGGVGGVLAWWVLLRRFIRSGPLLTI